MCSQYKHETTWKKCHAMELQDCEVTCIDWVRYLSFHRLFLVQSLLPTLTRECIDVYRIYMFVHF